MTIETLGVIVALVVVVQIIWIIWFTEAIADMRRFLRDIRHNSNATAFYIERLEGGEFAALNRSRKTRCGECGASAFFDDRRPVVYVRRHGVPAHLCLECTEKEHRAALRPWDRDRETAAVADLCEEAGIKQ